MERPFEVAPDLYPFTSRWQEVEGLPVHYVDEGKGPTLLFLHGNPTWSFLYRDLIKGLRDAFRCIALLTLLSALSEMRFVAPPNSP